MFTKLERKLEKFLEKLHFRVSMVKTILHGLMVMLMLATLGLAYIQAQFAGELGANNLVRGKFSDHGLRCLENFDGNKGKIDGYYVEFTDQGGFRTLTISWSTFFIPQSRTFTFVTTSGCILD